MIMSAENSATSTDNNQNKSSPYTCSRRFNIIIAPQTARGWLRIRNVAALGICACVFLVTCAKMKVCPTTLSFLLTLVGCPSKDRRTV